MRSPLHRISMPAAVACLLAVAAAGCASSGSETRVDYDPLEPLNRKVYRFNRALDKVTLKPLAKGYRRFFPAVVRTGFANVFSNFARPRAAMNNFLQGKPKRGFNEVGRFLFNSTLGIGGIFDVATAAGMDRYDESFSETLAVWGLPEGPYLIVPLIGPHSLLDTVGFSVDYLTDLNTYLTSGVKDRLYLFRVVDARVRLMTAETLLEKSNDPYITLRESYMQNRAFKVHDGSPPVDEEMYDAEMYEDFFEEAESPEED